MKKRKCKCCLQYRKYPESFVTSGKKIYNYCKICNARKARKWESKNIERVAAYKKAYYEKNKEKWRFYKRRERQEKRDGIRVKY